MSRANGLPPNKTWQGSMPIGAPNKHPAGTPSRRVSEKQKGISGTKAIFAVGSQIIERHACPAGNRRNTDLVADFCRRHQGSGDRETRAVVRFYRTWEGDLLPITQVFHDLRSDDSRMRVDPDTGARIDPGDLTTYEEYDSRWESLWTGSLKAVYSERFRELLPYLPKKYQILVMLHLDGCNQDQQAMHYSNEWNYRSGQSAVSHAMRKSVKLLAWLDKVVGLTWDIGTLPRIAWGPPKSRGAGDGLAPPSKKMQAISIPAFIDVYARSLNLTEVSAAFGMKQSAGSFFLAAVRQRLRDIGRSRDADLLDPQLHGLICCRQDGRNQKEPWTERHETKLRNLLKKHNLQ